MARSDYIPARSLEALLMACTTSNRLVLLVSMQTGLRISDVLAIHTQEISRQRWTVTEHKTGKKRRVRVTRELMMEVLAQSSDVWAFPGRVDPRKHRTRQAVYKDLRRAAAAFRLPPKIHVSPHTARKIYAVGKYKAGDLAGVQRLLQHSSEAVTILYAYADQITARKLTDAQQARLAPI